MSSKNVLQRSDRQLASEKPRAQLKGQILRPHGEPFESKFVGVEVRNCLLAGSPSMIYAKKIFFNDILRFICH